MTTQSNSKFEFGATCLGAVGVTAAWRRQKPGTEQKGISRWAPMVVVQQASAVDEGVFTPASEVTVSGTDALLALRAAIDEAIKHDA